MIITSHPSGSCSALKTPTENGADFDHIIPDLPSQACSCHRSSSASNSLSLLPQVTKQSLGLQIIQQNLGDSTTSIIWKHLSQITKRDQHMHVYLYARQMSAHLFQARHSLFNEHRDFHNKLSIYYLII